MQIINWSMLFGLLWSKRIQTTPREHSEHKKLISQPPLTKIMINHLTRGLSQNVRLMYEKCLEPLTTLTISAGLDTDLQRKAPYLKTAICPKLLHAAK